METPLPSRRITRSQTLNLSIENSNGAKIEKSNNGVMKSRQKKKHQEKEKEKSALIDITNGSPIVGVAVGSLKTPSSRRSTKKMTMISNSESKKTMTPGSGESLLRGQVKTLLQKVEEEEGVISKTCFEHNPWYHNRANTPHFSTSSNNGLKPFIVSPVAASFKFTQMLNEVISAPNQEIKGENNDEKNVITRSLFSDFSEKSHDSDSSDCNASLWSIEVNASANEDVTVDELCEGMSKISVNMTANKFSGKHTRFVYNSDGELEGAVSSS